MVKSKKVLLSLCMLLMVVFSSVAFAADTPPNSTTKSGYTLDFADEFNGPSLDTTKWIDYYFPHWCDNPETAKARYSFQNGCLIERIDEDQQAWCPEHDGTVKSSAIMSFDKSWIHNFSGTTDNHPRDTWYGYVTTYGYFEIRAKLNNTGGGGHQAWWMVGMQQDTNDWFNSTQTGEIDVLETFFSKPNTWRIAAYGWRDPTFQTSWYLSETSVPSGSPTSEFHIYAVDWSPGSLKFYYDNQLYKVIDDAPDYPMGTILNIYTDAGSGVHNDVWPKQWYIDYFRVWKKDGGYDPPYYRIKNRWNGQYIYDDNNTGIARYGDVPLSNLSSHWEKESVDSYVRYKNRQTGNYLHIEDQTGNVQSGPLGLPGWWSAQWMEESVDGYIRLKNRWQTSQYIHIEDLTGNVQYGNVPSTYWSNQWRFEQIQ